MIQLFDKNEIIDERILLIRPGTPLKLRNISHGSVRNFSQNGMVPIPGGSYSWKTTHGDNFIGYPNHDSTAVHYLEPFFMDRHPVTNVQFQFFIDETGYQPMDGHNFLKHCEGGEIPAGKEDYPVVYISIHDARAYAQWAGKRIPTELEWQFAAQAGQDIAWPWGSEFDSLKANPGNGIMDPVGIYPDAANPLGLEDLCGLIWQMTDDVYESGSYQYQIIKGGSFFKPTASWWYVQGGPKALMYRQMLLMVLEGFDRQGTVGFRCVADP